MKFVVETRNGKEALYCLQKVAGKTVRKWRSRLERAVEFVCAAILLGCFVTLIRLQSYTWATWFALIIGTIALLTGVFFYRIAAWKSGRMLLRRSDSVRYDFDEQGFTVINGDMETRCLYQVVFEMYRYRHFLILFVDKRHGYIVDEQGMVHGDSAELGLFLERSCHMKIEDLNVRK